MYQGKRTTAPTLAAMQWPWWLEVGCGIVRSVHSIKGNTLSFTTKLFSYSSFLHLRHNATRLYSIRRSSQAKYSYSNKRNASYPYHEQGHSIHFNSFFFLSSKPGDMANHPSIHVPFFFSSFFLLYYSTEVSQLFPPTPPVDGWDGIAHTPLPLY